MVHVGEAQVFEWQMPELLHRLVGRELAFFTCSNSFLMASEFMERLSVVRCQSFREILRVSSFHFETQLQSNGEEIGPSMSPTSLTVLRCKLRCPLRPTQFREP